ncbi:MAG TPA: c-type cytochrome domain-containing protein [Chthonomonadaceae bacterium]|nr:c-type cytochrome domain-containing protein [Chthonomonadaceae bacterium]
MQFRGLRSHLRIPFARAAAAGGLLALLSHGPALAAAPPKPASRPVTPISYHRQIWPILQARCQGCHQPASPGGKLVVTSFADLMRGGEHGVAVVANKPDASAVLDYLTGKKTLMPKGGPALPDADIALFRQWIAQGAKDDTPAVKDPIDAKHPPTYLAPPVITALAYSNDGTVLAVSGYREILLHHADGSGLVARLVGDAQKIQSIVYSQDGKLLAAVGGSPARFGEAQFWNTADNTLIKAVPVGFDTLFGAALSSDGKRLSFGGADNSVRVITVPDGKEVMRLDNHSDWVLSTAFSTDGKNVLSTGRDEAVKLTLVEGGSFVDDINTHLTPIRCMAKNPKADQVLVAGDDGIPRLYQIYRTKPRTMNQEDHNLLRAYPKQPGVVSAVAFSRDGAYIATGTESGVVNIYKTDNGGPAESDKPVIGGKPLASLGGAEGAIFAIAFRPDGGQVAVAGLDGIVRLYTLPTGALAKAFVPVPIRPSVRSARK